MNQQGAAGSPFLGGGAVDSYMHLVVLLVAIACVAAAIWALIDVIRSGATRGADRVLWCLAVILIPIAGVVAWLLVGRRPSHAR